jgi:hemoglobin-like flavoprotein
VLGHLLNSLIKDVLGQVATAPTVAEAWETLENMFSAQSRARVTNLRMQQAT